jgi:hypothetical protein
VAAVIASYTGTATLSVDGVELPVMVHVEARHRELVGATLPSAWTGRVTAGIDTLSLVGRELMLAIPGDRSGVVVVGDTSGNFTGLGAPPI